MLSNPPFVSHPLQYLNLDIFPSCISPRPSGDGTAVTQEAASSTLNGSSGGTPAQTTTFEMKDFGNDGDAWRCLCLMWFPALYISYSMQYDSIMFFLVISTKLHCPRPGGPVSSTPPALSPSPPETRAPAQLTGETAETQAQHLQNRLGACDLISANILITNSTYLYIIYMSIRQNYGMTKVVLSGLVVCRHSPNLHNR